MDITNEDSSLRAESRGGGDVARFLEPATFVFPAVVIGSMIGGVENSKDVAALVLPILYIAHSWHRYMRRNRLVHPWRESLVFVACGLMIYYAQVR